MMADMLRAISGACWALALTLVCVGAALAQSPVVIGMTAGFSGPTRAMAVELYRGALSCLEYHNRSRRGDARPVVLRAADDGYEPGPAIENTVGFLTRDKALALFSQLGTPTVSRVLPVLRAYADQGARLFFPVTGLEASRIPPYVRYAYNLRASYRQEIEALVAAFAARGATRVAICHQADAFGRSGWDGARRALARRNLPLCGEATFARTATAADDMAAQVRILSACKPQAILLIGPAPACAAAIRDLRRAGHDAMVGVVSFAGGELLLRQLAAEGARLGVDLEPGLIFSQVVPDWRDETLPAALEYRQALAELGDRLPPPGGWDNPASDAGSSVGFEGYLNARLMLALVAAMPDPDDRSGLDAAAVAIGETDIGIGRPVSLTSPNHQALDTVYLNTAQGGRLVPLAVSLAVAED
jgi:ABC-type branched-subunit amino acid transport system substrate-binding protein